MISGAAQADVALLMVPSNKGGFETSIAKGNHKKGEVQGQTRQHARLCHLLGIEQVIVGINKMDSKSVNWSEDRYNEIKGEVDKMLTKIGCEAMAMAMRALSLSLLSLCVAAMDCIGLLTHSVDSLRGLTE